MARRVLADEGLEVTAGRRFFANWFAEMYQDIEFDQFAAGGRVLCGHREHDS